MTQKMCGRLHLPKAFAQGKRLRLGCSAMQGDLQSTRQPKPTQQTWQRLILALHCRQTMPLSRRRLSQAGLLVAGATAAAAACSYWAPELYEAGRHIRAAWRSMQQPCTPVPESPGPDSSDGALQPPECHPIASLEDLLAWRPPACGSSADPCTALIFLAVQADLQDGERPRLLVCHDMQGGYLEQDRWPQGLPSAEGFRLWHWDVIDVFCYFSHHLVTIPPAGWINAAHTHGVQVLGTFITEGPAGAASCRQTFTSHATAEALADQLVAVAQHHGFEGWLLNIENSLSKEAVAVALHFVAYLRARMKACVRHSLVVWYDAVTTQGRLAWQNDLTRLNAPFFDAADAILLNYHWKQATPARAAAAAGRRKHEVFIGIDVHGRGTYGGGGDKCDVALAAARAAGVSAALFAPAWLYENHARAEFERRQEAWWRQVQHAWQQHRCVSHTLPFSTSFNIGCGSAMFLAGAPVGSSAWLNLSAQSVLPRLSELATEGWQAELTMKTAFQGGACLLLRRTSDGTDDQQGQATPVWLYRTRLPVPCNGIAVSYTLAVAEGSTNAGLLLLVDGNDSSNGSGGGGSGGSNSGSSSSRWSASNGAGSGFAVNGGSGRVLALLPPSSAASEPGHVVAERVPPGLPHGTTVVHTAAGSVRQPVHCCQTSTRPISMVSTAGSNGLQMEWVTRSCTVAAHQLQGRHITAIGVVLLPAPASMHTPQADTAAQVVDKGAGASQQAASEVLLGHVCIRERVQRHITAAQLQRPTILGLHASHVQLQLVAATANKQLEASAATDTARDVLLSCQLSWHVHAGDASQSFHVWMRLDTPPTSRASAPAEALAPSSAPAYKSSSNASSSGGSSGSHTAHTAAPTVLGGDWRWVGQAHATSFCVRQHVVVPGGRQQIKQPEQPAANQHHQQQQQQQQQQQRAPSVLFAVQPSGFMGCSRPLQQASTLRCALPDVLSP